MTLIYRSPNIIVEKFEWYAAVRRHNGHVGRYYYFRPLAVRPDNWQSIDRWKGYKPTGREFNEMFRPFRRHIEQAMLSEKVRLETVSRLALHAEQLAAPLAKAA